MAKKSNGTWKMISMIVLLVVIGAGVVRNFTKAETTATDAKKGVATLTEKGCDKAQSNETDILLLTKDVTVIRESQQKMEIRQEKIDEKLDAGFREILKRLSE